MSYLPFGKNILIKLIKEEEKLNGLIIPESSKKKQDTAIVIALGTGKVNDKGEIIPFVVKENDKVIYKSYGGYDLKIDNEDHIILTEDNIIAIIK